MMEGFSFYDCVAIALVKQKHSDLYSVISDTSVWRFRNYFTGIMIQTKELL
jgi:hypothetical protein